MTIKNLIVLKPYELPNHLLDSGLQGEAGLRTFIDTYGSPEAWLRQNVQHVRRNGLGLRGLTMEDVELEVTAPAFFSMIQSYNSAQLEKANWWKTESPTSKQHVVAPWGILICERYYAKADRPPARRSHTPPRRQQTGASSSRRSRPYNSPRRRQRSCTPPRRTRDSPRDKPSRRRSKSPESDRKVVLLSPRSTPKPSSPTRPALEPEKEKRRDPEEHSNRMRAPPAPSTQAPRQPPAKKPKEDTEEPPLSRQMQELKEMITMMSRRNEIVDKNIVKLAEIQAKMLKEIHDIKAQRSYPEQMVYHMPQQTGYYTTMPALPEPLATSLQAAEILNTTYQPAEPAKAAPQPAVPQPGSSTH